MEAWKEVLGGLAIMGGLFGTMFRALHSRIGELDRSSKEWRESLMSKKLDKEWYDKRYESCSANFKDIRESIVALSRDIQQVREKQIRIEEDVKHIKRNGGTKS